MKSVVNNKTRFILYGVVLFIFIPFYISVFNDKQSVLSLLSSITFGLLFSVIFVELTINVVIINFITKFLEGKYYKRKSKIIKISTALFIIGLIIVIGFSIVNHNVRKILEYPVWLVFFIQIHSGVVVFGDKVLYNMNIYDIKKLQKVELDESGNLTIEFTSQLNQIVRGKFEDTEELYNILKK